MGQATEVGVKQQPENDNSLHLKDAATRQKIRVVGIKAVVHPEGEDMKVLCFTEQHGEMEMIAKFGNSLGIQTEWNGAVTRATFRQSMKTADQQAVAFEEIFETALKPQELKIVVDRRNGDRLFVWQFDNRGPVVIRLGAEEVAEVTDMVRSLREQISN